MTGTGKILLFAALGVVSLFLSFFLVETTQLHYVVIYLSYPSLFLVFSILITGVYLAFRKDPSLKSLFRVRPLDILVIAAGSYFLFLFESFGFKIIFDELILSVTGQMLHFDRLAGMPQMGNDLQGSYILLDAVLDKRPLVFPFLLSTIHDILGFRYENVFILNALLTVLLVYLVFIVSRLLSGRRAAVLAVLLLVNLPLLSTFATSGHFEILNLVGLVSVLLWAFIYIRDPDAKKLVPLVYSLTILSQIRYENSIYVLPFGILILLGWKKANKVILPWQAIISPLLFVLYAMHYRLIFSQPTKVFQAGPNGREETFSFSYIPENLTSAVDYLFSIGQDSSNSLLISLLGISALGFFCAYALKRSAFLTGRDAKGTVMFFFLIAIFLFSLVIALFNFGLFNTYITNRLSLPVYLLFILLTPFVLRRYRKSFILGLLFITLLSGVLAVFFMEPSALASKGTHYGLGVLAATAILFWIWKAWKSSFRGLTALCLLYLMMVTMPIAHPSRYTESYKSPSAVEFELAFMESRPDREKILWVSSAPYTAMLNRISALPIQTIKRDPQVAARHFRDRNYTQIYIPRLWELDGNGEYVLSSEDEFLDPDIFEIERFEETPITNRVIYRIDILKGVHIPTKAPEEQPTDGAGGSGSDK